tara:strand:- start:30 stop:794 length:765 start_codon:yes stop_codon:yes gene_type:complete
MFSQISSIFNKNSTKKRIWVVGGSTGYGAAITEHYYLNGHNVIISSSNNKKLENYFNKLKNPNLDNFLEYIQMDLNNELKVEEVKENILSKGKIDSLIITSAIGNDLSPSYPLLESDTNIFNNFLKINSFGSWIVTRSLFPDICKIQDEIKIIFFSSKAGWSNTLNFAFYNLSKSLLHHIALNLFQEIKDKYPNFKLQLVVLEPGEAKSEMNRDSKINPKCILPVIDYIFKLKEYNEVVFLDRDKKRLKFINEL